MNLKTQKLQSLNAERIATELETLTSESVRGHVGRFLSMLLGSAVKAGILASSPWHKGYRSPKRNVPILDSHALFLLIEAATTVQPILALAGFCGLRRGEIFALTLADFGPDPENPQWVDVNKARIRGYGAYECDTIKSTKTGGRRLVPIPSVALPFLLPLLSDARSNKSDGLLFETFRSDVTRRIAKACKDTGLPKLTLHDLRHLCGSHLMQEAGPAAAQAVLGHKQVSTTVDVYGHLSPLYLKKQMEAGSIREDAETVMEEAETFLRHNDPTVTTFARKVRQLCQRLSIRNDKRVTESP